MNTIRLILVSLVTVSSAAQAAVPTMYTCQDKEDKNYTVSYTSTSFVGKPTMNIRNGTESLVPGDDRQELISLQSDETPLGLMVSAVMNRKFIADAPAVVYTLVVPGIRLGDHDRTVHFETILLEGSNGGFLALPAIYQRIHNVRHLACQASLVLF